MKKFIFIFCCILAVAANGQMVIKNSSQTVLVQVSPTGKVEIRDSVKVLALRNTSGNESSLIGANKNGTLIKAGLSLQTDGLVFFPVTRTVLVGNTNPGGVIQGSAGITDTLNAALDIQSKAGITLPAEATDVLIEYILALWAKPPTANIGYFNSGNNLAVGLYLADVANDWTGPGLNISQVDGCYGRQQCGPDATWIDYDGAYRLQTSGTTVVKLSSTKSIAFRFKHYNTSGPSVSTLFQSSLCRLVLAGYYVPISAFLSQ